MTVEKKLTRKDLWKMFYWCQWFTSGNNYEKFEYQGFTNALFPVFDRLYGDDKDKMIEAYQRHSELFLTECQSAKLVMGIAAAMEEKYANDPNFPVESIQGVKAAMMGPLAGIGDTLYHGTLRPIFAGIAVSMIQASNYTSPLGSIFFFIVMGGIGQLINWFGIFKGYEKGVEIVADIESSGMIDKIREYASILGCIIMGGFSAAFVTIKLAIEIPAGDSVINLQQTLDGLIPRLLPLSYTLFCYYLITKKKVNPILLMVLTIIMGAIGKLIGIFA
ncbi:MAG: PTS system mannose/fructose/sorbose family transporter subunit IID [Erysipelotrichaceae bacterium]|jgi:fructoselysine and glucoselysine-specific PTS system IID component